MERKIVGGLVVACVALAIVAVPSRASAQEEGPSAVHLSASELEWVGPVVPLWGDRSQPGEYAMFLRLAAGSESGLHAHTADYHGINIQGIWVRTVEGDPVEKELPPGSYVFQPGQQFHNDRCKGPEDCVLFIHQHAMGDVLTPPAAR